MSSMARAPTLSDKQIGAIDVSVASVLDAYKGGTITRKDAVLRISRVIVALSNGGEALALSDSEAARYQGHVSGIQQILGR
jgi:hypothetical protein